MAKELKHIKSTTSNTIITITSSTTNDEDDAPTTNNEDATPMIDMDASLIRFDNIGKVGCPVFANVHCTRAISKYDM